MAEPVELGIWPMPQVSSGHEVNHPVTIMLTWPKVSVVPLDRNDRYLRGLVEDGRELGEVGTGLSDSLAFDIS